ncbi:MAG: hypothetical protein H6Q54_1135 [Deltaproteobacteria bacterium]|jgi:hypothetical protein|nr:hypothetical protein [Deltaproteobacteria bacterium]
MWKMLNNVIEMFVYSAIYIVIALVSIKIFGAALTSEFEKKISDDSNLSLSVICAGLLIGLSLLLASVVR